MKKANAFVIVWAFSFSATLLFAETLNAVFWISFLVFVGCSLWLSKYGRDLIDDL